MLPTIEFTESREERVEERTAVAGLLNDSKKQSRAAESDQGSHVQECLVHESNNPTDKATNEILEIIDSLFTVEDLKAIRGLIENRRSEIHKILTEAARGFSPGALSAPANPAAFREEPAICGVGSDLVECSHEPALLSDSVLKREELL